MNNIPLEVQNAWEKVAKYLSEHEYATTFFINKETDFSIRNGNDVAYQINFINKKREFEILVKSSNVTTIEKVAEKIERTKDL